MKKNYFSKILIILSSLSLVSCGGETEQSSVPQEEVELVEETNSEERNDESSSDEQHSEQHNKENSEEHNREEESEEQHSKVPPHVHTIVKEEVKPTCTEGGYLKEECSDENCDYSKYEEYDALGHNIVSEVNSSTHISYGNHFEKAKAYSTCSRCKTKFEPFEYGTSTFVYDSAPYDIAEGDIELANEIRNVYKSMFEQLEDSFNNTVYEDKADNLNGIALSCKVSGNFQNKVGANGKKFYNFFREQNPFLFDSSIFSPSCQSYYQGSYFKISLKYRQGNHTPELRKQKLKVLDPVYKKCDDLIRTGASELERIIAVYYTVGTTLKYFTTRDNVFDALRNENKGNCQSYSRLFVILCNRYGISSYFQTDVNHAFNRVCVDGKWYYVEPQGYASQFLSDKYYYFLVDDYRDKTTHDFDPFFPLVDGRIGEVKDLKDKLFSVYKNNSLLGVYCDLDKTLESLVQDPEADYKISFGLNSVSNGKIPYYQNSGIEWTSNYSDAKFKSLLFTTDVDVLKNSTSETNFNISSELFNKENVSVENIKYTVV